MFICAELEEFNNYYILPKLQNPSNYVFLSVLVTIKEEYIQERKQTIVKNNKKEQKFGINILNSSISLNNSKNGKIKTVTETY